MGMWCCFSISARTGRGSCRWRFCSADFKGFDREVTPKVHYVTLTEYDATYGCPIVFHAADR